MRKLLGKLALFAVMIAPGAASAALPADYRVHLLSENFPPFNMASGNRNFARAGLGAHKSAAVSQLLESQHILPSETLLRG